MKTYRMLILFSGLLVSSTAQADDPAYMQIKPGQTAEIKGEWNKDGIFSATEIELLPDSRRPKLRGSIEGIDTAKNAIRIFGQWVVINPATQFLDMTDDVVAFSVFKEKQRIEVSCKIDSAGQWTARHLRINGVKASDKIKGTVTRIAYDGRSPDTLIIETLKVVVSDKTEVFRTIGGAAESAGETDSFDAKVR